MSQERLLEEDLPTDEVPKGTGTPGQNFAESLDYSRPYNRVLHARLRNPAPQISFLG